MWQMVKFVLHNDHTLISPCLPVSPILLNTWNHDNCRGDKYACHGGEEQNHDIQRSKSLGLPLRWTLILQISHVRHVSLTYKPF